MRIRIWFRIQLITLMWIRTFIWCGSRVPKWCRSMWNPDPDPRHCRTVCCTFTSVQVQEAVANCLPPLVPSVKDEAPKLVSELLNTLLTTGSTSTRHLAWGCLEGQGFSVNFILINYCLNLQLYFFLKDVIKSSTNVVDPEYKFSSWIRILSYIRKIQRKVRKKLNIL
jgi:hypothetical protein